MSKSNQDKFIVRSFKIRKEYDLLLSQMAFWGRKHKQDILDSILGEGLDKYQEFVPEIPPGKEGWRVNKKK